MKAITIHQPWAWSIMHGKLIENRTWPTTLHGPIAIHAGKAWNWDGANSPLVQEAWRQAGHDVDHLNPPHPQFAFGAVVAVADLGDICGKGVPEFDSDGRCSCGTWAARGQYHWNLANVRPLARPVECRGLQRIWTLPADVEAAVVAQLGERSDA